MEAPSSMPRSPYQRLSQIEPEAAGVRARQPSDVHHSDSGPRRRRLEIRHRPRHVHVNFKPSRDLSCYSSGDITNFFVVVVFLLFQAQRRDCRRIGPYCRTHLACRTNGSKRYRRARRSSSGSVGRGNQDHEQPDYYGTSLKPGVRKLRTFRY